MTYIVHTLIYCSNIVLSWAGPIKTSLEQLKIAVNLILGGLFTEI